MIDRITITDGSLTAELRVWLLDMLQGNEKDVVGLYHVLAHGVQSWDAYNRVVGQIQAFESVVRQMNHIANQHGETTEEQVIITRPGLN